MEFSGKVALVTGGAEGIGKGIVETLMAHGILGVAVLDINEEKGMETCKHFTSKYSDSKVEFFRCDVSEEESLKDTFFRAYQHFGRLDIVCNNAGIVDEYNWDRMLKTNLHAVIRGTYLAVELMGTKYGGNGGVVVNVSSIAGLLNQFSLCPVYCAAKYGVVGFTRSAAVSNMYARYQESCVE
ncbi:15-hydroxyprostaglandin dehydrogenase [NAD(+)]-like [Ptychodera flava]|uniref:15-hydroxyprostaglandin dehydrogenase [NAD(+)]-like n=1 Tax=Ptychodera flava TaxID=63121 RepID=UPI00396A830A